MYVSSEGTEANIFRTWTSRFATDHPALRRFHLQAQVDHWTYGPYALRRKEIPSPKPTLKQAEVMGHYRSYSPWYTNFRVILREGALYLVASGGVESQTDDCLLVDLGAESFRIGAQEWLPERLTVGPVVNGKAISVIRDGCMYSRSFTD